MLRRLTVQSIAMGIAGRLVTLDYVAATIRDAPEPMVRFLMLPERLKHFTGAVEKLGYWFSKVSLYEMVSTLAVEL